MDKLLRETMSVNEAEETYRQQVRLTLHFEDAQDVPALDDDNFVNAPDKVELEYDIEIEKRSWGINGINVSLRGVLKLDLEIGQEPVLIEIDFSSTDVEIVWMDGAVYIPEELHVTLNAKDGYSVKAVEVDFFYLKP